MRFFLGNTLLLLSSSDLFYNGQACRSLSKFDNMVLVVRNDEMEDKYSILIRFDEQNSADGFYEYYNGRHFNSLEVCIAT